MRQSSSEYSMGALENARRAGREKDHASFFLKVFQAFMALDAMEVVGYKAPFALLLMTDSETTPKQCRTIGS